MAIQFLTNLATTRSCRLPELLQEPWHQSPITWWNLGKRSARSAVIYVNFSLKSIVMNLVDIVTLITIYMKKDTVGYDTL